MQHGYAEPRRHCFVRQLDRVHREGACYANKAGKSCDRVAADLHRFPANGMEGVPLFRRTTGPKNPVMLGVVVHSTDTRVSHLVKINRDTTAPYLRVWT